MRLVRLGAEAPPPILLVLLVVSFEPYRLAVALEGENMRRDSVEEPPVVGDHHDRSREGEQRLLQGTERVDV